MEDFFIRTYKKGDEIQIIKLFKLAFGEEMTLEEWQWKYQNNPEGFVTFLGLFGNVIVSHYGIPYIKLKLGNKLIRAASPGDTMVHPDYRGKRGGKLAFFSEKIWAEQSVKDNYHLGFGFPNERVYKVGKRFGKYQDVGKVDVLWKYLVRGWKRGKILQEMSRVYFKFNYFFKKLKVKKGDFKIKKITCFDERADNLWEEVKDLYPIAIVRNKGYLNWRYVERPVDYTIFCLEKGEKWLGWIVLRVKREEFNDIFVKAGYIVDMLTVNRRDVAECLIMTAIDFFFKKRAFFIETWLSPVDKNYNTFKNFGFFKQREVYMVWRPFLIKKEREKQLVSDINNWYVTLSEALVV